MPTRPALLLALLVTGCGSDGGGDSECGFASDRYLPYDVGMSWTYRITDVGSGEVATKQQDLDETDDPDLGPVIVQTTGKLGGTTRSLLRVEGDRVVRLLQEDRDDTGALERTTTYDPGQIRIDESPDRTVVDATWDEQYDETVTPTGGAPVTTATTDTWEVLAVDAACESPLGSFACLHLRRTRAAGGVAQKEFFFARGVGKVRETGGNQIEELTACGG
jgi:hypothetical protein